MSIQPPEEFLNQSPSAFLNQPSFLEQGLQAPAAPPVKDHPDLAKIAVGIAAALVVLRILMKTEFAQKDVRTPQEINESARKIWKRILPAWLQVSVPVITQAYQLGSTAGGVSYEELEAMATQYASELGEYVNDTSILALTEGFNSQVNAGWSERLAWVRAREAYGLDSQQMRSYVKGLMNADKTDYVTDPIPPASRSAIDRAFLYRADRLGQNESYKATQVGRNLVWLSMQASGQIPEGTMKRWITADDERVCVVCGPLDQVTIPLHRRFESAGRYFYAPGVHPNCRCTIELVYPDLGNDVVKALGGDPYNRNKDGEFASRESRGAKGIAAKPKGIAGERKPGIASQAGIAGAAQSIAASLGSEEASRGIAAQDKAIMEGLGIAGAAKGIATAKHGIAFNELIADGISDATTEKKALKPIVAEKKALKPIVAEKVKEKKTTLVAKPKTKLRAKAKDIKTPQPSDPQKHDGVFYVPASRFMRVMRMEPRDVTEIGAPITLGDVHPESGVHGLKGFHQVMSNADLKDSPAFEKAFDQYMETTGFEIRQKIKTAKGGKEGGRDAASYKEFGDNDDLKEFGEERKALAGLTGKELRRIIQLGISTPEGAQAIAGSSLTNEDWVEAASPNDLANEIMWALKSEADLYDDFYARHNAWRGRPWREIIKPLRDNNVEAVDADDVEESTINDKVRPIFFRLEGWYGVDPEKEDAGTGVRHGEAEGNYVVSRVDTVDLPDSVASSEADEIMDKVVVVTLKLAKPPGR